MRDRLVVPRPAAESLHRPRFLAIGLVAIVTSLVLAACGGPDGESARTDALTDGSAQVEADLTEITVLVTDVFGAPVNGATVSARGAGGESWQGVTGADGLAGFGVGDRQVGITATAEGYSIADESSVPVMDMNDPDTQLVLMPIPEGDGVWLIGEREIIQLPVSRLTVDPQWPMNYTITDEEFTIELPTGRQGFIVKGFEFSQMHDVAFPPGVSFGQGGVMLNGTRSEYRTEGPDLVVYEFDVRAGRWVLAEYGPPADFPDATAVVGNEAVLLRASPGGATLVPGSSPMGELDLSPGEVPETIEGMAGTYGSTDTTLRIQPDGSVVMQSGAISIEAQADLLVDADGTTRLALHADDGSMEFVSVRSIPGGIALEDDWGNRLALEGNQ